METKFLIEEGIEGFVSRLTDLLNDKYDKNKTLTTVFFVKDRKMRIRTGKI